jgi:hypothetical protein
MDITLFHPAPKYGSDLQPSTAVTYWEERIVFESGEMIIVGSTLDSCLYRETPCPGPLADYRTDKGERIENIFGPNSRRYFVGWTGSKIKVWKDAQATRSFLLPVNSEGDAVYWASKLGYGGNENDGQVWIRTQGSGYELICERTVHRCHPYHKVQVTLRVDSKGNTQETARHTSVYQPDGCVMH